VDRIRAHMERIRDHGIEYATGSDTGLRDRIRMEVDRIHWLDVGGIESGLVDGIRVCGSDIAMVDRIHVF